MTIPTIIVTVLLIAAVIGWIISARGKAKASNQLTETKRQLETATKVAEHWRRLADSKPATTAAAEKLGFLKPRPKSSAARPAPTRANRPTTPARISAPAPSRSNDSYAGNDLLTGMMMGSLIAPMGMSRPAEDTPADSGAGHSYWGDNSTPTPDATPSSSSSDSSSSSSSSYDSGSSSSSSSYDSGSSSSYDSGSSFSGGDSGSF